VAEFGSAVAIGQAAALADSGIGWLGRFLQTYADRWIMLVVPLAGVAVAALAIVYAEATGKATSDVLFSGHNAPTRSSRTPPATPWGRWCCLRSARGSPTACR